MKKLLILTLILTLTMSLFAFAPTLVSAENTTPDEEHASSMVLQTDILNRPIYDGVNYYIDIKSPSIFASYEKVLVVAQGDDVIVKLDENIHRLSGVAYFTGADGARYPLKNIAINRVNAFNGYIYFTYNNRPSYETVVYQYFLRGSDSKLDIVGNLGTYIDQRNINASPEDKTRLNEGALDICVVSINDECILYVVSYYGDIYKITSSMVTKIDIDKTWTPMIINATSVTVSDAEDIYIYGGTDTNGKIYKKASDSTTFVEVASYAGLIDMVANGNYVYLLEPTKLTIASGNNVASKLYEMPLPNECKTFDVSHIGDTTYISFALANTHNISTYKVVEENKKVSLVYDNHYGANCTCDVPHQGWFNAPTLITASAKGNTIYVVDNAGKRLVILKYDNTKKNYTQYFYNIDELMLSSVDSIGVDRQNNLHIASGDNIYVYSNSEDYSTSDLPLRRKAVYEGFDGNIIDMKVVNKSESEIYALTDKHTAYRILEADTKPKSIATFDSKTIAIAPSYDSSRIYVATSHSVSSYAIDGIDVTKPLTSFTSTSNINDIYVDYTGAVFATTSDSVILRYARIGDDTYKLSNRITTTSNWRNLSSIYIDIDTKTLYTVDSSLHIAERTHISVFGNSNDKYEDKNAYDPALQYVAKTTDRAKVYESPVNYEIYDYADQGTYFYILATDKNNNDMYLAVDSDSHFVYLKKTSLAKVEATNNSILGVTLMPLFGGTTNIYLYPFENSVSQPIDSTKGTMSLVHNVAYDGGTVWQNENTKWLKVSYVSDTNVPVQGYVKMNEVTRSTNINAPATKIHLRITTDGIKTVKMYDAPDLASGVIESGIKNGTLVRLMQEEFDTSAEFTLVELEVNGIKKVGYILTQNLQENTFTTLQIVAIIVSVITVIATIVIVVLIVELKKKKDNANSFKDNADDLE